MSNNRRIKILFTIPNFDTAGSGIHLFSIAKILDKNIFNVEIACKHDRGIFFQVVKNTGIKIHFIDLYKKSRPIKTMLFECYKLAKQFKKINPDIIHSYHYLADYTEPIAARMAGIKWVYTKKNMSWEGPSYRAWRLRSFIANGIIAQNSDMMQLFFHRYKEVKLIPMGINVNDYEKQSLNQEIVKQWSINAETRIIMTVANMVPVKGIEILIKVFENISHRYKNWKLIIVGNDSTDYAIGLKEYVQNKSHLINKIIFTGEQKNVSELLSLAEIYVQPTLDIGRKEGGPIATLEAMANGKVILGSNISGIRDQLLNKFPDHLFSAGDINELEAKLEKFMSKSKAENENIGGKFLNYVKKEFDILIQKMKTEEFYLNLIK